MRFRLIDRLLETGRFERLLEIGYGSGIFMPQLHTYCDELYGIDPHGRASEVGAVLQANKIAATLRNSSVTELPFEDGYFGCVVAVSALEFVSDLPAACREIRRVLRPDGCLVLVTPGHSPIADLGLKLLTGVRAKTDFEDRRQAVGSILRAHFEVDKELHVPALGGPLMRLYTGLQMRNV